VNSGLLSSLAAGHGAGVHFAHVVLMVAAVHWRRFGCFRCTAMTGVVVTVDGALIGAAAHAGCGHERGAHDWRIKEDQAQKAEQGLKLPESHSLWLTSGHGSSDFKFTTIRCWSYSQASVAGLNLPQGVVRAAVCGPGVERF
jgi:hypothetical protein